MSKQKWITSSPNDYSLEYILNNLAQRHDFFFFNNSFVAIICLEDNSIDDIQKQKDRLLKTYISKQIRINFIT